ncbi:hypothetical protein [Paenibacillus sp. NPDC058071]|uniref:hypothetical protein n=1 Tax=Paenibacillus sp. NPDC058071 TaxID=3346326 RepID=UPI0036DACB85
MSVGVIAKLLLALLLGSAIPGQTWQSTASSSVFDPEQVEEGDILSGLTVERIDYNAKDRSSVHVFFTGEILVKGTYWQEPVCETGCSGEEHGGAIWFTVSSESRLPIASYEESRRAFLLEGSPLTGEGKATLVIKNYEIHYEGKEIVNTADFVRLAH